jgi:hypothetical protein
MQKLHQKTDESQVKTGKTLIVSTNKTEPVFVPTLLIAEFEAEKMALGLNKRAVGIFSTRREAEHALSELRASGFSMDKVSVVAQDSDRNDQLAGADMSDRVGNKADEGAATGAVTGGALGGIGGLLVGLGTLAIPGIGPIMLAGAGATALATTLAGAGIGAAAGSLIGALVGLGIPEERARVYNERVSRGEYLVIVDGTADDIRRAEAILSHRGIQEWGIYDAPGATPARTDYDVVDRTPGVAAAPTGYVDTNRYDTPGVAAASTGYIPTTPTRQVTGMVGRQQRAIGVFANRRDAESALSELRDSGFPMDKVSVIAKNADHNDRLGGAGMSDRTGNKADEGAAGGAVTGGALGGLGGLLVGLGTLAIPGIGPVVLAGAGATALATTLAGAGIGAAAGSIIGALVGLGIPEGRARVYNERFSRGEYLVLVDGTADDIRRAEAILSRRGIQEWGIYDASDAAPARTDYDVANRTSGVAAAPTGYIPTTPTRQATGIVDRQQRGVGVFANRRDAESALNHQRDSGFPMDKVSVIAKDADHNDRLGGADMSSRVGNKADEGAATGAVTGGALGGLGGLLVGLGTLAIPGIGPIVLAGAGATALATTLAGAGIGAAAGSLIGALVGLGIPEERARAYNERVSRGEYLVMVDGTADDIHRSQAIYSNQGIQDWGVYNAPEVGTNPTGYAATATPAVDTTRTSYPSTVADSDPQVIIVDRRDQI